MEEVFGKAEALEKQYDWTKAPDLYSQALRIVGKKEFLKMGKLQERIGFCFHRAAFQAENQKEFKERMQRAIEAYEKANGFYEKTAEEKAAWMFRCDALTKYLGYWLASDPSEKRKLLDECLKSEGKALAIFLESGDKLEYGRTYNELSLVFWCRAFLEWDRQTLKSIVEKGLEWGDRAVAVLTKLGDSYEIARAYFAYATCLTFFKHFFVSEPEKKERQRLKVVEHLRNAVEFSEAIEDAFLVGLSHLWLGLNTGGEESMDHFEKVLECGKDTRDNFLKAWGLDLLAYMTYRKAIATVDPDQRGKLAEEAMQFYDESQHHNSIMSFQSLRGGVIAQPGGYAEHYLNQAIWETDAERKLELLEKSEKAGMKALKVAEDSDVPNVTLTMLHVLSKTLQARARMESDINIRRNLFEKALKYRERSTEILEQLEPFEYFNLGVMHNFLADLKAELGHLEQDLNSKRRLLDEAVSNKERCLELVAKAVPYFEKMGEAEYFAGIYWFQDSYGALLDRLYELTSNPEHLRKAIEISQKAIESASKLDMVSLMAESYWKIAKAHDILGEHLEAAENFEHASENYLKAAEKIPQLKDFYQDYASYMQAWNEIEKAKNYHAEKRYGKAKEHYEKAADLHKSTERWNYLDQNYLALARFEEAEDLSRREQTEEARGLFQQAAALFAEAKKSVQAKPIEKIESKDERDLLLNLVEASDIRCEYCLGRIALEEAKILHRHGDSTSSSAKYGLAARIFQKIGQVGPRQGRKELQPIVCLCQAWQKMMMAEAKASSTMYGEAAKLFEQAKEHTLDQPTSLLALANSSFCKALEAGTKFEMTRGIAMYSTAKKYMEAAENYYLKAGFKTGSDYAKATQRLFDGYMYVDKAETETNPREKAQYYRMAEKLLEASTALYMEAKHLEKHEQAKRLLESVREERQLAMSLTEVLHAPAIASATTSFSTPTPTHEKAVGVERFEHGAIEADLVLSSTDIRAGEIFKLEMRIVNIGKEAVLLAKVEDVLPAGFELVAEPDYCHLEDAHLDLKGKRLDPLKTEEITLVLMSFDKGTYEIEPRIMYVDDIGHQMVLEPKPVAVEVSEIVLPGRITTGCADVDNLLFGGIPRNYAVILTSPSCDERSYLIKRFLETGAKKGEVTFYVTIDPGEVETLAEGFQSNFYLFICNPQADAIVKSLPNVFKLKGVENLTEIGIALSSAFRRLDKSLKSSRRACIEIISDVLLQHHAVHTRRWLSALIPELRSKGFTTLAVIDPQMHPPKEFHAILNLFEGEINIYEKETVKGPRKYLKIKKMTNQEYLENEVPLKKERLQKRKRQGKRNC